MPENSRIKNLSDFCLETKEYLLKQSDEPELSFPRLRTLNEKMWGIQKSWLTIIAARPSNGKTAMAMCLAYEIAKSGKKVLFLSLEMTIPRLLRRLFCMVYKISNKVLQTSAFKNSQEMQDKFDAFQNDLQKISFVGSDLIGKKAIDVEEHLRKIKPIKPDVIFIDHIQEISAGLDKRKAMEDYLDNLRTIATRENIAIVVCSQINRLSQTENENRIPQLHQLKGTGALEEKVDVAILLHWPYHYDNNKNFNYFEVNLAKNRDGETCYIKLNFHPQFSSFEEWEEIKPDKIDGKGWED